MPDALETLKLLGPAFLDAWYVVDDQDRIVDFNAAFHALFPRHVARGLKTLTCKDALKLPACEAEKCLRLRCAEERSLRLDELDAEIGGEKVRVIVSATRIELPDGKVGALIVLRNVTDDARVQGRYQELLEAAERAQRDLQDRLDARTRELVAANEELNRLERELARARRGGA